jgi:decaprenyl-phosphate phosphoribosyltransferase
MNIFYTIWLKHIAVIDITIIAIGFVLRIFAGAYLINVTVSMWIILVTFWLALFLALAKRRDEYLHFLNGKKVRKNIEGYNLEMINSGMIMLATITIMAYVMYSVSTEIIKNIGSDKLYLTSIFVVVGIFRYLQITYVFQKSGDPTKILLKDKFLQITIILWIISFYIIHQYGKYI